MLHIASSFNSMRQVNCEICRGFREIVWRSSAAIEKDSTASASMISGGFALHGKMETRMTLKSRTTTKEGRMPKKIAPVHPGEVLREDVLKPLGMSVNKLAL